MQRTAAIVLAGGESSRMGRDKAAIPLGGRTLLQRAVDAVAAVAQVTVVVLAPGRPAPALDAPEEVRVTHDAEGGQGPLAGLLAGLETLRESGDVDVALLVACDQPFLRPALLRLLAERAARATAAVPVVDGRPHLATAAIRVDALDALRERYERGARAAAVLLDLPGVELVAPEVWRTVDPEGLSFIGANTPEELARCESLLARLD